MRKLLFFLGFIPSAEYSFYESNSNHFIEHGIVTTPWRNGSASDSRSEGCVFKSRRGHKLLSGSSVTKAIKAKIIWASALVSLLGAMDSALDF